MRKYDKKILYALVVAYMNGLIGKKPLKKWIDKNDMFTNIMKKVILIISFSYLIILLNEGLLISKNEYVIIGSKLIQVYRIYNALLFIPMVITLQRLITYILKSYYVNRCISTYHYEESDVSVLDKVTFKIKT